MRQVDVNGFENYQVTDDGRVWSKKHKKWLKLFSNNVGYLQVYLSKNGKQKWFKIHKLVAEAFIPNPNGYKEINHKDDNKENNVVENLEWCDRSHNMLWNGLSAKISEKLKKKVYQYTIDGNLIKIYESSKDAAKYGFNSSCISNCCYGRVLTHKGYKWSHVPL